MAKLVIGTNKQNGVPAVVVPSGPKYYIGKAIDANGKIQLSDFNIDFSEATSIADYALTYAFWHNPRVPSQIAFGFSTFDGREAGRSAFEGCYTLTKVSFPNLTTAAGYDSMRMMFISCQYLTEISFPLLATVSGSQPFVNTFSSCTRLSTASFPSLTTVTAVNGCQSMFSSCTGLTTLSLPSLREASGNYCLNNMCSSCSALTTVDLSSLTIITGRQACGSMFAQCRNLTSLSFPAITTSSFGSSYTDQFDRMCQSIPNITLHFPSNVQSAIEGLTGYSTTAPFGAVAGTVLFDLPATE